MRKNTFWRQLFILGHLSFKPDTPGIEEESDAFKQAERESIAEFGDDSDSVYARRAYIAKKLNFTYEKA